MTRPVSTTVRVRRTVALFTAGTLGMALVDVTPFRILTAMIALVGVYAVRCAR